MNELQKLEGVTVLAFPCNQFGLQEPGKNSEILNILREVRPGNQYVPNFNVFEKLDVNGENEHPLFTFMKSKCDQVSETFQYRERLFYDRIKPNDIEWNFHKFLVDHEGKMFRRFNHNISPESEKLRNDIEYLLRRRNNA